MSSVEGGGTDSAGSPVQIAAAAAVVHHPEPASLALFGSGLAGVAWIRRRGARRQTSR
ncbi:MAG: PEP-CTERM sorting domain-containing protein [Candidatus Omnitrophica bacterium]|nr:PEP-CTERM sorting domain-containing protein [Candidatus Omnitrophota bacterium]